MRGQVGVINPTNKLGYFTNIPDRYDALHAYCLPGTLSCPSTFNIRRVARPGVVSSDQRRLLNLSSAGLGRQ